MINNNRGLDSFKILIPTNKLLFDERLNKEVFLVYKDFSTTGEIIKEFERKPLEIHENGIHTTYGFIKYFGTEFVYILISAKTLKLKYFHGINNTNIYDVYSYIKSQSIVDLTFSEFLLGNLVDVDIKSDFEMLSEPFKRMCYERKQVIKYAKIFSKDPNLGIEYVKRDIATPSNPFVKYYSKLAELDARSKEFKDFYFPHFYNINYRRVEVTVKNMKHKQYLLRKKAIDKIPLTLKDWLELNSNDLKRIIVHCIDQHEKNIVNLSKVRKVSRNVNLLSASDYYLYQLYKELLSFKMSDLHIVGLFEKRSNVKNSTHYQQKSRVSKKIKKFRDIYDSGFKYFFNSNPFI